MRSLWAHAPGGARMSLHTWKCLHVRRPHHAPRVRPHLPRGHERRLHAPGSHGGAHLLGHAERKALLAWGAPRTSSSGEGGRGLPLRVAPLRAQLVHSIHLHLLENKQEQEVSRGSSGLLLRAAPPPPPHLQEHGVGVLQSRHLLLDLRLRLLLHVHFLLRLPVFGQVSTRRHHWYLVLRPGLQKRTQNHSAGSSG